MQKLSSLFKRIAYKRLSRVEIDKSLSNQHEFNGSNDLKEFFGLEKLQFTSNVILLGNDDEEPEWSQTELTWYDSRDRHPTRSEYRLYYSNSDLISQTSENDLFIICQLISGEYVVILAKAQSTAEQQIQWLFGIDPNEQDSFTQLTNDEFSNKNLILSVRQIVEALGFDFGILIPDSEVDFLPRLLELFPEGFPSTKVFSDYAADTFSGAHPREDPDSALIELMEWEEKLFFTLEKHFVSERLKDGFREHEEINVAEFISYSLSVHNRRKSRAGHALQNHVARILDHHDIRYTSQGRTENKKRPDILFPSNEAYAQGTEPLDMLGIKTSCKDRWRQVLDEAEKIPSKFLLTLEAGISLDQTTQMTSSGLTLVVPEILHDSYKDSQKPGLLSFRNFIDNMKPRHPR